MEMHSWKLSHSHWQTNSHIHPVLVQTGKSSNVNSQFALCYLGKCHLPELGALFLQCVTGIETGCFWYCFGDAPWWRPIRCQVQGGAMWSGPNGSPSRPWTCYRLDLGLLHVIYNLENGGHSGLHPAGLINAGLSLKVASGLEFQTFVRSFGDAGAAAEGLLKTSTKPMEKKHRLVSIRLVLMYISKFLCFICCGLKIYKGSFFMLISFIPRYFLHAEIKHRYKLIIIIWSGHKHFSTWMLMLLVSCCANCSL